MKVKSRYQSRRRDWKLEISGLGLETVNLVSLFPVLRNVECGLRNVECGVRVNFGFGPFRPVEVVLENGFEK